MGELTFQNAAWLWGAGAAMGLGAALALISLRRIGRTASAAWAVRGLLLALVLTAIAGPTWRRPAGRAKLAVLVDRSASMPVGWARPMAVRLREILPGADLHFYAFARGARQADPQQHDAFAPADPADGSDASQAGRMAANQLGPGDVPVLLLTDGNWTAPPKWADGWAGPIWAICPQTARPNAAMTNLSAAEAGGGSVAVRAVVSATRAGPAVVSLSAGQETAWRLLGQRRVEPAAGGSQSVDWIVPAPAPNESLRATVSAEWDELAGDNELETLVAPPAGLRRVLLVTHDPSGQTGRAIRSLAGWQVVTVTADKADGSAMIRTAPGRTDAVILDDVGPNDISGATASRLETYVRDGGGLIVLGGRRLGGSSRSYAWPVEAVLPVTSQVRNRPAAAIVLLLDRSGSMSESPAPTTGPDAIRTSAAKLELVKQAVLELPDLFSPSDRLAVIGFSDQAKAAYASADSPINWRQVRAAMLEMTPSGGTAIGPALKAAADWLAGQDFARKHVLLLTDGQFDDLNCEQAAKLLARAATAGQKLTVSTFAAARDDRPFLRELAERFGGTYFPPGGWGRLTDRFRDDLAGTMIEPVIVGPLKVEADNRPALPSVRRMLAAELVEGRGRMMYSARPAAGRSWPLVAAGPFGAGRSAAVATSFDPEWAGEFSSSAARLMADLLDHVAPGDDPRFTMQIAAADSGRLTVAVRAEELEPDSRRGPRPINLLDLSAELLGDDRIARVEPLRQVAPGQYVGEVAVSATRWLRIVQRLADGSSRTVLRRASGPGRSAEFSHLTPQPGDLDRLCREHGGRLLESLDELKDAPPVRPPRSENLSPWLLLLAVAMWLAEIGLINRLTD